MSWYSTICQGQKLPHIEDDFSRRVARVAAEIYRIAAREFPGLRYSNVWVKFTPNGFEPHRNKEGTPFWDFAVYYQNLEDTDITLLGTGPVDLMNPKDLREAIEGYAGLVALHHGKLVRTASLSE